MSNGYPQWIGGRTQWNMGWKPLLWLLGAVIGGLGNGPQAQAGPLGNSAPNANGQVAQRPCLSADCLPAAARFGYYSTQWRRWPGEVRPDQLFPQAIGRERLPTPGPEPIPEFPRQKILPQKPSPPPLPKLPTELPLVPPEEKPSAPSGASSSPLLPPDKPLRIEERSPLESIQPNPLEPMAPSLPGPQTPSEKSPLPLEPVEKPPVEMPLPLEPLPTEKPSPRLPLPSVPKEPLPSLPKESSSSDSSSGGILSGLGQGVSSPASPPASKERSSFVGAAPAGEPVVSSGQLPSAELPPNGPFAEPTPPPLASQPALQLPPQRTPEAERLAGASSQLPPQGDPTSHGPKSPLGAAGNIESSFGSAMESAPLPAGFSSPPSGEAPSGWPREDLPSPSETHSETEAHLPPASNLAEPLEPWAEPTARNPSAFAGGVPAPGGPESSGGEPTWPQQSPTPTVASPATFQTEAPSMPGGLTETDPDGPYGLEGYCPVTLLEKEEWVPGNPQFAVQHQGKVYLLAGPAQQKRFLANPVRYIPADGGMDPVLAVEENRHVPGRTEFCAVYDGRLYLFSSAETLARFHQDPKKYAAWARWGR